MEALKIFINSENNGGLKIIYNFVLSDLFCGLLFLTQDVRCLKMEIPYYKDKDKEPLLIYTAQGSPSDAKSCLLSMGALSATMY